MKKTSLTIFFYCLLGLIFYGCTCYQTYISGSSGLRVGGFTTKDTITNIDIVYGQFSITDDHEVEYLSNNYAGFGMQQAYAFSPCINLMNKIEESQSELYFDQPFTLDSETLPASTNLLENTTFRKHIYMNSYSEEDYSQFSISLDSSFFFPPVFTNGPMHIKLITKTDNGLTFTSELNVIMDF